MGRLRIFSTAGRILLHFDLPAAMGVVGTINTVLNAALEKDNDEKVVVDNVISPSGPAGTSTIYYLPYEISGDSVIYILPKKQLCI